MSVVGVALSWKHHAIAIEESITKLALTDAPR